MKRIHHSKSAGDTEDIASRLARSLKGGSVVALVGELGSGKTTFVKGMTRELGAASMVQSPTFVIAKRYPAVRHKGIDVINHIDCYRIRDPREILEAGLTDMLSDDRALTVIEWAEKIREHLPAHTIWINFTDEGAERRMIKITIPDPNAPN